MKWRSRQANSYMYRLRNAKKRDDQTHVWLSRSAMWTVDFKELEKRLNDLNVPFAYTVGIKHIKFTRLKNVAGDYFDGVMRISATIPGMEVADRTIVHELGHHLDDTFGVTKDGKLTSERETHGQFMPDGYAKKNDAEYLSCGFEVFYCGNRVEKAKMRQKNPILYKTIANLHRRFR